MWMRRLRREIRELNHQCARAASDEEKASFELTRSARDFSRRTREVADDKLAFSATLVRAGEFEAANRLIAELEVDVRTEEAALAEQVNEAKVVSAMRREKMTRLRLTRTLAVATLSAGVLMLSVAGVAVGAFIEDLVDNSGAPVPRSVDEGTAFSALDHPASRPGNMKNIRFADGTRIALSRDQFLALKRLTRSGDVNRAQLERLLVELVGPEMAGKLAAVLADATTQAGALTNELDSAGSGQRRTSMQGPRTPATSPRLSLRSPGTRGRSTSPAPRTSRTVAATSTRRSAEDFQATQNRRCRSRLNGAEGAVPVVA